MKKLTLPCHTKLNQVWNYDSESLMKYAELKINCFFLIMNLRDTTICVTGELDIVSNPM